MIGKLPGGELATRPLHFIWICDCSGSMEGAKIQSLNMAIRESIPHMRQVADDNPHAEVLVRAVKFSTEAEWHIKEPTPIEKVRWIDLEAQRGGRTNMGRALTLIASQLKSPPMPERALPPVLALVSDGYPSDSFESGLAALLAEPWGQKSVRVALAIGSDVDQDVLQNFMGHSQLKPMQANNPEDLVSCIKWVSTAVLKYVSAPPAFP